MSLYIKTKTPSVLFSFVILLLLTVDAFAACDRSDVSYYLQQGFTNKEIVSLCQGNTSTSNQTNSESMGTNNYNNNQPPQNNFRFRSLINSLDVTDISITEDDFSFTLPYCMMYGEEDNEGYRDEECPNVRFTIDTKTMNVVRSEKRSLIKSHEILIRGNMRTTLLDDYYEKRKALILKAIGKPNEVWIQIKRGKNTNQVVSELRKMLKSLAVAK